MYRLRLPRVLHDDDNFNVKPKDDDDVMMGQEIRNKEHKTQNKKVGVKAGAMVNVDIDWPVYINQFKNEKKENLPVKIATVLFLKGVFDLDLLNQYAEKDSRENYIRSLTIGMMSMPEYQMH
jgi:hypothetical protein